MCYTLWIRAKYGFPSITENVSRCQNSSFTEGSWFLCKICVFGFLSSFFLWIINITGSLIKSVTLFLCYSSLDAEMFFISLFLICRNVCKCRNLFSDKTRFYAWFLKGCSIRVIKKEKKWACWYISKPRHCKEEVDFSYTQATTMQRKATTVKRKHRLQKTQAVQNGYLLITLIF